MVLYASTAGVRPYFDVEMKTEISWASNLITGYEHEFLPGASETPTSGLFAVFNPGLWRSLSRYKPDALVTYGYSQLNSLVATAWARLHRKPVAMISDSSSNYIIPGTAQFAKRLALRLLSKQYRILFTVGDSNEEYWLRHGASQTQLVRLPFSIDEEAFESARSNARAHRSRICRDLNIPSDRLLLLNVGKLSERKRQTDLLEAVAEDHELRGRVHVLLAGDGALREDLAELIARFGIPATILGFVNTDALPAYYAAADAYVHCASRDPHPLTLTEAACCGLPLIVSNTVGAIGPTDVARAGVNTLTYQTGNSADLCTALRTLVTSKSMRHEMGEVSRQIFETMTLEKLSRTLVNTLGSIR